MARRARIASGGGEVLELVDLEFRGFAFESPDVRTSGTSDRFPFLPSSPRKSGAKAPLRDRSVQWHCGVKSASRVRNDARFVLLPSRFELNAGRSMRRRPLRPPMRPAWGKTAPSSTPDKPLFTAPTHPRTSGLSVVVNKSKLVLCSRVVFTQGCTRTYATVRKTWKRRQEQRNAGNRLHACARGLVGRGCFSACCTPAPPGSLLRTSQDRLVEPTGPAAIISRPYDTLRTCLPARMLACSASLGFPGLHNVTSQSMLECCHSYVCAASEKSGSLLGSVGLWALLICACFAAQHCASSWCSSSSA